MLKGGFGCARGFYRQFGALIRSLSTTVFSFSGQGCANNMPPNLFQENQKSDEDSVKQPLLSTYGTGALSGLSERVWGNGKKSTVVVVEVNGKRVFITDVKNAHAIVGASKDGPTGGTKNVPTSKSEDSLALVVPEESSDGYSVKTLEPSEGPLRDNEPRDHKMVRDFVRCLESFRFGEGDTTSPWRFRIPLLITAFLLLLTIMAMIIWAFAFRGGFGFEDPVLLSNFHPFLMTMGFMFFSGYAMLFYRGLTWLDKTTVKILHAAFQFMAIVCIGIGILAIRTSVSIQFPERPLFSTLHAWLGIITSSLMTKQFLTAFFAFIVGYFCYKNETTTLRERLVPIHTTLGLVTFVLAGATTLTGLNEKVIFSLSDVFILFTSEEALYVNVVGLLIVAVTTSMVFTLRDDRSRRSNQPNIYVIDNFN